MQAQQYPTQRGWAWLKEGFELWKKNPASLIFASFTYLLILLIITAVPLIGQPIASLIMPILSLSVLNTCRAVDEGRKAGPELMLSGFKSQMVGTLVTIGGFYLLGTIAALALTSLFDGGTLIGIMSGTIALDPDAGLPNLTVPMLIAMTLSLPVLMAYWFAPILAGWWRQPAAKALFFSFYACAKNWRPFLAYGFALFIFMGLLPGIVVAVAGMIAPMLATIMVLMMPMVLVPVTFASFYINARDVFGVNTSF